MKTMDAKELIKQARRPEKTVALCLRGDLQAEWERLERELANEMRNVQQTLATKNPLADRMAALEEEMRESTLVFQLRALPSPDWHKLRGEHPPREDNETDRGLRINMQTFFPALIQACVIEPDDLDEADFAALFDNISDGQFDKLADAAWQLNRGDVNVPFSPAVSLMTSSTGGTSKQLSDSESPTSGSAGGSRRRSRNTSTTPKVD